MMRPPSEREPNGRQPWARSVVWILVGLAIVLLLFGPQLLGGGGRPIDFSRFLQLVQDGKITEVTFAPGSAEGTYETGSGSTNGGVAFTTTLPPNYDLKPLVDKLTSQGVRVDASRPSGLTQFLVIWGLPLLLLIGGYFLLRRMMRARLADGGGVGGGGPFGFGRSKAKLYERTNLRTTFQDVAGLDEVRTEVAELVDYLKRPGRFRKLGARIPKGVLLVGPPGTGKTLLARAVAGEADVPFFSVSASTFVEMLVGAGAARVRDLFEQARRRSPAIVFIDEIDAIGQARAGRMASQLGGHQEREQTLQQLLSEMDGFEPNSGVIIMAATNRPEVLDQALLRPGRFDRQIVVHLPDVRGRRDILKLHARGVALGPDADLETVARRTPGFSGAQLANIVNEAALLAGRREKDQVEMTDLEDAIDRVVAGLERRSQIISDEERRMIACHEAGHAVVGHLMPHGDRVHRISIVPRGIGALGFTQQLPDEDRYLISEPQLRDRLATLLGGRSAEGLVFGFVTSGAQDDLRKATDIARRMVTEFGMSEAVGPVTVAEPDSDFLQGALLRRSDLSDETEQAVDREVRALLEQARARARTTLSEHREALERLMTALLREETLERPRIEELLGRGPDAEAMSA